MNISKNSTKYAIILSILFLQKTMNNYRAIYRLCLSCLCFIAFQHESYCNNSYKCSDTALLKSIYPNLHAVWHVLSCYNSHVMSHVTTVMTCLQSQHVTTVMAWLPVDRHIYVQFYASVIKKIIHLWAFLLIFKMRRNIIWRKYT